MSSRPSEARGEIFTMTLYMKGDHYDTYLHPHLPIRPLVGTYENEQWRRQEKKMRRLIYCCNVRRELKKKGVGSAA